MTRLSLIGVFAVWAFMSANVFAADEPAVAATEKPPAKQPATQAKPGAKAATKSNEAQSNKAKSNDQLVLDATVVSGNRELPKVMYIVPWKKADLGNLPGQPFNSLLDEALTPVDRDVFRREVAYYRTISAKDHPANQAGVDQPTQKTDSK